MKVCFDVYAHDLADVRERATSTLAAFLRQEPGPEWHIDIDVHEETRTANDDISMWRGEVTAKHRPPGWPHHDR